MNKQKPDNNDPRFEAYMRAFEWEDTPEAFDGRMRDYLRTGDENRLPHAPATGGAAPMPAWKIYTYGLAFAAAALLAVLWTRHILMPEDDASLADIGAQTQSLERVQAQCVYGGRVVLMRDTITREQRLLAQGDVFYQVTVETIGDTVTVSNGGHKRTLLPLRVSNDLFLEAGADMPAPGISLTGDADLCERDYWLAEYFRDHLHSMVRGYMPQDEYPFSEFAALLHERTDCPLWVSERLLDEDEYVQIYSHAGGSDTWYFLLLDSTRTGSSGQWWFWPEVVGGKAYLHLGTLQEYRDYNQRLERSVWDLGAELQEIDLPSDPGYERTQHALRAYILKRNSLPEEQCVVDGARLVTLAGRDWLHRSHREVASLMRQFRETIWDKLGFKFSEEAYTTVKLLNIPEAATVGMQDDQVEAFVQELTDIIRASKLAEEAQQMDLGGRLPALSVTASAESVERIQYALDKLGEGADLEFVRIYLSNTRTQ